MCPYVMRGRDSKLPPLDLGLQALPQLLPKAAKWGPQLFRALPSWKGVVPAGF